MKIQYTYPRTGPFRIYVILLPLFFIYMTACGSRSDRKGSGAGNQEDVSIEEVTYEGRAHYLVKTSALDYYYDVRGGGFSRILDKQGNDWISFRMEPWGTYPASAASSYRGLPNLVFQHQDDGAGHPGHDKCVSRIESGRIISETLSGLWRWSWEFHEDHAILELLRTDPGRAYWFLYEGTPGGSYKPDGTFFGSSQGGPYPATYDYFQGNILWGSFRWFYAWQEQAEGSFYMIQEKEDTHRDLISFLGNTEEGLYSPDGMTVFGFGRDKDATPLMKNVQRFIVGLYPEQVRDSLQHQALKSYIESTFLQ